MAGKLKYYWDACAWIGLIQQEPDKIDSLNHMIERAKAGEIEIWTSAFTLAEVFKRPCNGQKIGLGDDQDIPFEDYIEQDFVQVAQVDSDVGRLARRLLRQYPSISKPQDGIHVATACIYNVDELHTFDREDLLGLSGQIAKQDGGKLTICNPPEPPPKEVAAQMPLFRENGSDAQKEKD